MMEKEKLNELILSYQEFRIYYHVCRPEEKPIIYKTIKKLETILLNHVGHLY